MHQVLFHAEVALLCLTAERHLAQATFRGSFTLVFPRQRILQHVLPPDYILETELDCAQSAV
jgi:hypothetical protein